MFTITCISAGGPASCVIWRRYDDIIINPITTSVLTNSAAGRYIHTLTVTERTEGPYYCVISDNRQTTVEAAVYADRKYMYIQVVLNYSIIIACVLKPNFPNKKH